ncbi:MAG TPA: methyltransferase domain-containing protein [Thermodesulfovibrionales bacterium]|nr:methyltransferase domain-containing protein [Thermodesulfovibrionales bacterium]
MTEVHCLSKKEIKKFAFQKRASGEFYDVNVSDLESDFLGSIDRFCDIALEFRGSPRVLDVGSGSGLLLALLRMLGHEVHAVDLCDHSADDVYMRHKIPFSICNIEADSLPFESESLDAVSCCQALEHFTHSHLTPVLEMKRVLVVGGLLEIDVPNAVCFRNRSRMLRGKHITWDYKKHYLYEEPVLYKGREYYPGRHNREFTKKELEILLSEAGFREIEVRFLKSRNKRTGFQQLKSVATAFKDSIPSMRKSLIAFAKKQ